MMVAQDHQSIKFLLALRDVELEEIILYNELSDLVSKQDQVKIDGHKSYGVITKSLSMKAHSNTKIPAKKMPLGTL